MRGRNPEQTNSYRYPFFEERPVILKIHGSMHPADENLRGYVVAEDHYIDYLAREPLSSLLPPIIVEKLQQSYFLFLGYGLADWNLRVFLRRIQRTPRDVVRSTATLGRGGELAGVGSQRVPFLLLQPMVRIDVMVPF